MTATQTTLKNALLVDFTGTASGFTQLDRFGTEFVSLVRNAKNKPVSVVVIDHALAGSVNAGTGKSAEQAVLIRDHINLTGTNPLTGPNNECGDRFPVVQGVYITDYLPELPRVVAGGLKDGVKPTASDLELLGQFGVGASCYNAVPAMIIAAHARCTMLAVLVPEGQSLPAAVLEEIKKLTGAR